MPWRPSISDLTDIFTSTEAGSYWDTVRPTYIENWPEALLELSFPSKGVPLTTEEAHLLGLTQIELFETWPDLPTSAGRRSMVLAQIRERLDDAIRHVGGAAFVRLGSRSAKDSYSDVGPRVTSAEEALTRLLCTSERINDDLHLAVANHYNPWLWARKWEDVKPWEEFRCFVQARELVGVSQYQYSDHSCEPDGHYPPIHENRLLIAGALAGFIEEDVIPALHVDSAVVDVVVKLEPHYGESLATPWLLEINPYFSLTDPCLFSWEEPVSGFRYIGPDGKVVKT